MLRIVTTGLFKELEAQLLFYLYLYVSLYLSRSSRNCSARGLRLFFLFMPIISIAIIAIVALTIHGPQFHLILIIFEPLLLLTKHLKRIIIMLFPTTILFLIVQLCYYLLACSSSIRWMRFLGVAVFVFHLNELFGLLVAEVLGKSPFLSAISIYKLFGQVVDLWSLLIF